MTGVFSEYQPQYARHGIATFPVKVSSDEKKPAVTNYRKMGLPASAKMARKHADAQAFGFCCGPHSKVTVIDYDSTDETLLREGNRIFGESPLMVRTNKGLHAYYRHNGERWGIRPFDGLDLDILGEGGGFTVAAPSKGVHRPYEFIRGGLDTLADLPAARTPDVLLAPAEPSQAADGYQHQAGDKIPDGRRNNWLFNDLLHQALHVDNFDALLDVAHTRNMECDPPMDDTRIVGLARHVWFDYHLAGKNWIRQKAKAQTDRAEILVLARNPAAALLLNLLRVSHTTAGDIFAISQIETGELLGWDRTTVRGAISTLLQANKLERTHFGGRGPNDPHLYRLPALVVINHP